MKTLFIILFLYEGPKSVCVTSATFLCSTPATNTDVLEPRAGWLCFVYLGRATLENLPLSYTNGHLILCWELHSHCLFCISNIDFCNFFNSLRLRSVSLRFFFFPAQKSCISFPKFPFSHSDKTVIDGTLGEGQAQVLASPYLSFVLIPATDASKKHLYIFLIVTGMEDEKQESCFSQWPKLPSASQAFPNTF